jgi:hypothetical protein
MVMKKKKKDEMSEDHPASPEFDALSRQYKQ